jgi:hypothetical protein
MEAHIVSYKLTIALVTLALGVGYFAGREVSLHRDSACSRSGHT